jgi:hypothetical protein
MVVENDNINIKIMCDTTSLKSSESTSCKITGYSDSEITGLQFKLDSSSGINISDITTSSIWEGDGEDGNVILYTDESKSDNFDIATFKVTCKKANKKSTITASDIYISDEQYNLIQLENTSLEINKQNNSVFNLNILFLIIAIVLIIIMLFIFKKKKH